MSRPVIVWFRRDLRLEDNLALEAALKSGAAIIPLFIFDPDILDKPRISSARVKFMLSALNSLDDSLRAYGRRLLVRHGEALPTLQSLIAESGATALYFNADYTPFARKRDETIRDALSIDIRTYHDRLMMPPGSVMTNDDTPYSVYSPFKRKWREKKAERLHIAQYTLSAENLHDLDGLQNDGLPELAALGHSSAVDVPRTDAAHVDALLDGWIDERIYGYKAGRDMLGDPHATPHSATSFFSPYIRFGILSTRTIYWRCHEAYEAADDKAGRESVTKFVDEIIWHEFYTHVLWHHPHVVDQNFNEKYDALQWRHAPDMLAAWQNGMTGYPVVDAAMRQLNTTGWMHNRARMVVASFLTKDLLIDWREGELYFMQRLLDGDLANNNGGWQWAAGTGTDAQPYFRIFNPLSQSQKFDPQGVYIRTWTPELRDVADRYIHEPHNAPTPPKSYPAPIVDHQMARQAALQMFEAAKRPEGN